MSNNEFIPVLLNEQPLWVKAEDVLYVKRISRDESIVQTATTTYINCMKFEHIYTFYGEECGFELFDKSLLVNFSKVQSYNSDNFKIYFSDQMSIDVNQKKITDLKKRLGKEKDRNTKSYEYAPLKPQSASDCQ